MPRPISIPHQVLNAAEKVRPALNAAEKMRPALNAAEEARPAIDAAKKARQAAQMAEQLSEAERRVSTLRGQLDGKLFDWHEQGASIAALARATGLSRETVYKSIDRYRSQFGT